MNFTPLHFLGLKILGISFGCFEEKKIEGKIEFFFVSRFFESGWFGWFLGGGYRIYRILIPNLKTNRLVSDLFFWVSCAYFLSLRSSVVLLSMGFLSEIVWLTLPEVCLVQAKSRGFLCSSFILSH